MSAGLFEAIAAGDEDAVRVLVETQPELLDSRDDEGFSPVLYALYNGKVDLVEVLLEANPSLDVFDAAAVGRTRGLEALLDADPDLVHAWSGDGFTPLHYAAYFGQDDAARILVERGADTRVVAQHATIVVTPLHSAAAAGRAGIVRLLLEHGADPNAAQDGGFTPLHAAAANDDRESVEALLEAGADPTRVSDEGRTPADVAGDGVRDLLG